MLAPRYSSRLRTKSLLSRHSAKRPAPKPVRSTRFSQSLGMIWSVSTSLRSSGTARGGMTWTASRAGSGISGEGGGGGEAAGHHRGGGDRGGDEVGAPAPALAALEVAVR